MVRRGSLKALQDAFEMKAMADAFVDSANRSRYVIIVIVFASVLAFIASWNSWTCNWIHSRCEVARWGLRHCVTELPERDDSLLKRLCDIWAIHEKLPETDWPSEQELTSAAKDMSNSDSRIRVERLIERHKVLAEQSARIKAQKQWRRADPIQKFKRLLGWRLGDWVKHPSMLVQAGPPEDDWVQRIGRDAVIALRAEIEKESKKQWSYWGRARGVCIHRGIFDQGGWAEYARQLDALQVEKVLIISVPIFGTLLDVNDLGLVAGFVLFILVVWFRFALRREFINLHTFFAEAGSRGKLVPWYDYLAMRQVLTLPWSTSDMRKGVAEPRTVWQSFWNLFKERRPRPRRIFWHVIRYLLFLLPLLVDGAIVVYDSCSLAIGGFARPEMIVRIVFAASVLWLIAIFILTSRCISLSELIDQEWDDAYNAVKGGNRGVQ